MKTIFTNDEFRDLINKKIYAAAIDDSVYDVVMTNYLNDDGNYCLAFVNDYDHEDSYIFPWDEIKSIRYSEMFRVFDIITNDGYPYQVRLLTSYVPC